MLILNRKLGERIFMAGERYCLTLQSITYGVGETEYAVVDWADTWRPGEPVQSFTLAARRPAAFQEVAPETGIRVCLHRVVSRKEAQLGIEAPQEVDVQREEILRRAA
jgi:sRNA-binding carbon storage regulator CsrA